MTDKKIEFSIEGKDFEKLKKFHRKHENCLEKHPNMTGAQYSYSFISDGLGTLKSCKCVCGKAITMSSDYNLTFNEDEECKLKVVPEDAKTKEVVHILQSMHIRPGMYFGKTRSYIALRAFLFGYGAGVRAQGEEECYWSHDLGYEVDEELRKMTEGKEFSDEELFNKFFEAFDLVLNRDYPQYLEDMNWGEKVIKKDDSE